MGVGRRIPAVGRWPLTGRSDELAAARDALRDRQGVVVLGDAGVGKTRLVREVMDTFGPDVTWHAVTGSRGASAVPLGAWSHLLPETWDRAGDDVATWRLLAAHLGAADGDIHLVVDDAHWLDAVSTGLLHHLLTTGAARALVTARRGEGDAQLTALWKDDHLLRVDLEPFGEAETEAALEAALGDPVEPRTARRLHDESGGNALMLRELVDAGLSDGSLRRAHGAWVQTASGRPGPRLADLLADRVGDLPPDERAGAELLALGEPMTESLFRGLAGADVADRLAARGLVQIEVVGETRVARSAHPLVAQVLLDHMPAPRRDATIATLIDAFDEPDATPTAADTMRVALWRLDTGAPLAAKPAAAAAELALARTDFTLAERFATHAVDAGDRALGTVILGEALVGQQRHVEAEHVLAPLHDDLEVLDEELRLRYALVRALALGTDLGRVDDAVAVLQSTLATLATGPRQRMLEARLADRLADCGRLRAAAPLADALIEGVDDDEPAALGALVAGCLARTLSGRCRETLDLCDRMTPVALDRRDEVPDALGWIAAQRMLALHTDGDLAPAGEFAAALEAAVVDDPDTTRRALVLVMRGMVMADQGRLDEGLRRLQQAAALHELGNRRGYQSICFAITARVHAERNDVEAARAALRAARDHLWHAGQVLDFEIDVAAVWVAARGGDRAEAELRLAQGLARAQREGATSVEAYLRHEAVRAGLDPTAHVDALCRFAEEDEGRRGSAWGRHVAALVAGDGAGLDAAAAEFAGLGQHLRAAEAHAQAAFAHARAGSRALAARARTLGEAERAQCTGAATPALQSDLAVAGLTRRELDVITQAASGATSRDIADALGISVRTVETHLQRAFDKLGIHRRAELVDLLGSA